MKIRIIGEPILVNRILDLVESGSRSYPSRELGTTRGYFELDDESIKKLLDKVEKTGSWQGDIKDERTSIQGRD